MGWVVVSVKGWWSTLCKIVKGRGRICQTLKDRDVGGCDVGE